MSNWRVALFTAIPSERPFRPMHLKLQEACRQEGIRLDLFKNGNFCFSVQPNNCKLFYESEPVVPRHYDLAIVRLAVRAAHGGNYYAVRHFERQGIPIVNPPQSMLRAKDKLQTLEVLAEAGIPVTPTAVARTHEQIPRALSLIGAPPYIVKHCFGSRGTEVLQANTSAQVYAIFDSLWSLDRHQVLLLQPFLGPQPMADVRALYFHYHPWRAVLRVAKEGEFRTNLHTGSVSTPVELTTEEKEICETATRILQLPLAGIDFLRTPEGPIVMEVNGCPGFEGITQTYAACGVDIVSEFVSNISRYLQSESTPLIPSRSGRELELGRLTLNEERASYGGRNQI